MPVIVLLAIGFDPWLFESQRAAWRSSGCVVSPAASISEGINHFRDGDFDAVLLGSLLSERSRERIVSLIRSSGSGTPILCVTEPSGSCGSCEFAAIKNEPKAVAQRIAELLVSRLKKPAANAASGAGRSPAPVRLPTMNTGRSGVKLRARRAAQWELSLEQLTLPKLPDSPGVTICFRAQGQACAKGGELIQPKVNPSGRWAANAG